MGKDGEDDAPKGRKLASPASAGQRDRSSRLPGIYWAFKEDSKKELLGSGDTITDSSVSTQDRTQIERTICVPENEQRKGDGRRCRRATAAAKGARGGKLNTSQAPVVPACDWSDKVSDPIKQNDNTCAISACIMCMDALHRIAYEKIYGTGSFGFKVQASAAKELKAAFRKDEGAHQDEVLNSMISNGGLPTVGNITRLTCKEYELCYTVSAEATMVMLTQGPVVGGMVYGAGYKDIRGDLVYEGAKEGEIVTSHAVVCVGYKFIGGNRLLIKIIDNQEPSGPIRWVNHKAFQSFAVIKVDPVDNKKS